MQELMTSYKLFHDTLDSFAKQLPSHLTSDAPEGLANNVDVLTTMLTPTDPHFFDGEVKLLQKKFNWVRQVLRAVLCLSFPKVKKESHSWFVAERTKFQTQVDTIKPIMERLTLSGSGVITMPSGIGGNNTGVQQTSYFNPLKLEKLKQALLECLLQIEQEDENSTYTFQCPRL